MSKALLYPLGQSISFGRLSLKAKVLWPMLLAASDDQGRGLAEADAVAWHVCPNVREISIDDVPGLLGEMVEQEMIRLYEDSRDRAIYQVLRWWEFQRHAWAHPSRYEAPEGWTDRIRYQAKGQGYVAENWDHSGGYAEAVVSDEPPDEQPEDNQAGDEVRSEVGSEVGRSLPTPTTQLNSTQLNSTQDKTSPANAGADAPSPDSPEPEIPKPRPPTSFQEWIGYVHKPPEGSNTVAVLVRMHEYLYPGRSPPEFGYMGKVAKAIGGAGHLAELLWTHSAKPPTGDVLAYIQAAEKRRKERGNGSSRRHSQAGEKINIQGYTPRAADPSEFYDDEPAPGGV